MAMEDPRDGDNVVCGVEGGLCQDAIELGGSFNLLSFNLSWMVAVSS